ncbi:MAG: hypothetical protein ACE37M_02105 [Henriciella sp.]
MPQTKPRYRQLADQFRKEITTGKYKPGDAHLVAQCPGTKATIFEPAPSAGPMRREF